MEHFYDGAMKEKKYAFIASIPEREKMLEKTVASLRNQVDELRVSLNEYHHIPKFLHEKEVVLLDNSKGDAAKFYFADRFKGYIFTCDDDLIYPPNYCDYLIQAVNKYKCICTLHGRKYPRPVIGFQHVLLGYPCLGSVPYDIQVDVGGDGVMCYHTDFFNITYDEFTKKNMSQLFVARKAYELGVKIMGIRHEYNYLTYQNPEWTIWDDSMKNDFKEQTEFLKGFLK